MYVEKYVSPEAGEEALSQDTAQAVAPLVKAALAISDLVRLTGCKEPSVIPLTFRRECMCVCRARRGGGGGHRLQGAMVYFLSLAVFAPFYSVVLCCLLHRWSLTTDVYV